MSDLIALRNASAEAAVALLGAELRAWNVMGRALIWTPDPVIWADTAPVLFPVVGWTRGGVVRVDEQVYPLALHGFARASLFVVAERGDDWVRLETTASPETLRLYPFDFTLSVTYRLEGTTLRTELAVLNCGTSAMPYACGLHPGFCWPFSGGDPARYTLTFAEEEAAEVPVISADGLFTYGRRSIPLAARRLPLSDTLLAREALCFLQARSRSLCFAGDDGSAITLSWEDFPHIALWSRPGAGFLSIELWTGHGDFVDSDGDLRTKPSMIHLAPGATRRHAATYAYAPHGLAAG